MEQSPSSGANTHSLTHSLTQLVKKFTAFYGTLSLMTAFITAHYWTLFCILSQMNPAPTHSTYFFKTHLK